MSNLSANELQEQKDTSSSPAVSQEQEAEATVGTGSQNCTNIRHISDHQLTSEPVLAVASDSSSWLRRVEPSVVFTICIMASHHCY